jgi:hypothetical protein
MAPVPGPRETVPSGWSRNTGSGIEEQNAVKKLLGIVAMLMVAVARH